MVKARRTKTRISKKRNSAKKSAAQKTAPVFHIENLIQSLALKCLVLVLLIGMNWQGLWAVGETVAFFNDTEESAGNGFTAGELDFSLDPTEINEEINLGGSASFSSDIVDANNVAWKYTMEAEKITGSDDMCNALELAADVNGTAQYNGAFLLLHTEATSTISTWNFDITLPNDVADGDTCKIDIIWRGWQAEVPTYEESGFSDEERISVTLTARDESSSSVVLNEFLPNPNGFEYGFDFGADSDDMPQGEWVELYNASSTPFDLTGWYIEDASGGAGNTIYITSANTDLATTTISGTSWLVVYMNKAVLNNTGDTVKLFNADDELIDSHAYTSNDYCDLEPTPGDPNDTEPSGSCGGVPPNKSYARIPDGIGEWVDPIPTPGGVNRLGEVEEVIAAENADSSQVNVPMDDASTSDEAGLDPLALGDPSQTDENTSQINEQISDFIEEVIDAILPSPYEETLEQEPILAEGQSPIVEESAEEETLPTEGPVDTTEPVIEPELVEAPAPDPEEIVAEEPPPEETPPAESEPVSEPVAIPEEITI